MTDSIKAWNFALASGGASGGPERRGRHITLGDGTVVTAKTGVTQDTPAGAMVSGFPSRPHKEWLRATANLFTLDELRRRVKKLEEAVRQLGGKA